MSTEPDAGNTTKPANLAHFAHIALIVLGTLAILFTLHLLREVLIPVAIGVLLTYPVEPMVAWLARRRVPRSIGSALVLLLTLTPISLGAYAFSGELGAIADKLPAAARRVVGELDRGGRSSGSGPLRSMQETAAVLERSARKAAAAPAPGVARVEVQPARFSATEFLWSNSVGMFTVAGNALMTLFLVYFLLASGDLYRKKLIHITGRAQQELTSEILDDINSRITRYLLSVLAANLVVFLISAAVFASLGLQQPVMWGFIAGALNTIPYFGPMLVTIGVGLAAGVQFGTVAEILAVCVAALAITSLEGWWLTPMLMGRAAKMNAVAVFVSLILWTWLWGVWGTLLAVPIMTIVKSVSDRIDGLESVGKILGD